MAKLLIIGYVWPEPTSSAAGSRMLQLIELFSELNYTITFATPALKTENTFELESIKVKTASILLNSDSFNHFVEKLNPEIVLFDRFMMEEQFGWRVSESCPDAIKILDTEDLHGLRKARGIALKAEREFQTSDLLNDTMKREIASIYRCDLTLIISEYEMKLLKSFFKIDSSLVYYLPFLTPPISYEIQHQLMNKNAQRQHFITVGNFLHAPNYDLVLYLKQTIWPILRKKIPQAQLHVYGAYCSEKVKQLHNPKTGFYIKGYTKNIHDTMQNYKICLVPLRYGAGLKGKIIDALASGTPCVTSTIGAEGMYGKYKIGYDLIGDTPDVFVKHVLSIFNNTLIYTEKQALGFEILASRFNKTQFFEPFKRSVVDLKLRLKHHRESNFIGAMLQHQTLQSTKYFSKWIAIKNKVN